MTRLLLVLAGATLLGGCSFIGRGAKPKPAVAASVPLPTPPRLAAITEWLPTLGAALGAVDSGRYDVADRVIADYMRRFPGTHEGREMAFWRAMFKLDPNNKTASTAEAISDLDAYVEDTTVSWYKSEAAVLLRLGTTIAVLRSALSQRNGTATRDSTTKSREEEIQSLKEALARANAELERIKKRVGKGS